MMSDAALREGRTAARTLANKYYRLFPAETRAYLEFEDLASIGIMHFLRVAGKFDDTKSARYTFAYNVIERKFIELLRQALRPKYHAALVPLDAAFLKAAPSAETCAFVQKRLSRFYDLASIELRGILDTLRDGGAVTIKPNLAPLRAEVVRLRRLTGVTVEDFRVLGLV
jgi:DNA-directed RNA polymerase specialized sigma24 family protein